jgi:hypothetical protein
MTPDDAMEKVAALADYPLADLVHTGYQLLARNRSKEPGTQLLIGDGVVEDDPAEGPQGRQRGLDGLALAAELLVELVLGLSLCAGQ